MEATPTPFRVHVSDEELAVPGFVLRNLRVIIRVIMRVMRVMIRVTIRVMRIIIRVIIYFEVTVTGIHSKY